MQPYITPAGPDPLNRRLIHVARPGIVVPGVGLGGGGSGSSLLTGLVAGWKLEEGDGAPREDVLGTHTLSDENSVTQETGVNGFGAGFVRANAERLYAADHVDLKFGAGVEKTISFWVRLQDVSTSFQYILAKYSTADRGYAIIYRGSSKNHFTVFAEDTAAGFKSMDHTNFGAASADTWYHLVFWWQDSDDTMHLRINDTSEQSASVALGITGDETNEFSLGNRSDNNNPASCWIDDVYVWDRPLTAEEITTLYNAGAGAEYPFS